MITLNHVTKRYYSQTALDNVSVTVPRGEVVGLLGPNGAGKTTLLKLVAGLITPTGGHIQPTSHGWPAIGYKPERLLYPNRLRVSQYLVLMARSSNVAKAKIEQVVLESLARVNLLDVANKPIGQLSKGMRQRLGLAQALVGDPPLLLLDEPSDGLDPEGREEIGRYIQALGAAGKTVLMSSHQLEEVTQVCTYLIILHQGSIHYENSMSAALALRPFVRIRVERDLAPVKELLRSLHSDIEVEQNWVTLRRDAMQLRRHVLTLLLNMDYDVLRVDQKRVTLAEIYAEAVR